MFACVLCLLKTPRTHIRAGRPTDGLPTRNGHATRAVNAVANADVRSLGRGRCVSGCKITHFFGSHSRLLSFLSKFLWKRNETTKIMSNVGCRIWNGLRRSIADNEVRGVVRCSRCTRISAQKAEYDWADECPEKAFGHN